MSRGPRRDNLVDQYNKGEYANDLRFFSEKCIRIFFQKKKSFDGSRIPESELISDFSRETVLKTQFDDRCFDFIHKYCLPLFPINIEYKESTIPWTVHCLLGLIKDLKRLDIPKELQPGLLLLYFKFCWNVKIPNPPLL